MAFFKKVLKKITGKWYPEVVIVGKPVTTDEVADRLAEISTVSRGDTYAVLKDLGQVMGQFMAEDVKASQIENVRVRFIPETTRTASNKVATRSMVNQKIWWEEWKGEEKKKPTP